jgi:hypothetical protein
LERFQNLPAVDGEDVLDVCRFLRDFDGDFLELFRQDLDEPHG